MRCCTPDRWDEVGHLFGRFGLTLARVADGDPIPGSYWGEPEAGLIGHTIHARADTPLHSVLHEACHVICMDADRRANLHTDASGEYAEENAVCYLQIVLAQSLGISEQALCADMDEWGYTFRLGSAYAWFTQDADDARTWLADRGLITAAGAPAYRLRTAWNVATA